MLPQKMTAQVRGTMVSGSGPDPVAKQYTYDPREELREEADLNDPIGDDAHSPTKGIVHRYPDRVLLKLTHICAVYCRYCFRKEMIGPEQDGLKPEELEAALDYIAHTPEIWEVILTGGDPLVLSARRLKAVMDRLNAIDHVKIIRIHTKIPVVQPDKITEEFYDSLTGAKPLYVVIHVNHAQELTEEVREACTTLRRSGTILLSQSVLLKDVNDTSETMEALLRRLVEFGVKPYYLHHHDLVPGTTHFRTSIKTGQDIMKALRGQVSGLCLPDYVLDIPGGYGKVPLTPCYWQDGVVEDIKGNHHHYQDHL